MSEVAEPNLQSNLRLFVCRNSDALQRLRPKVYGQLDPTLELSRYRFRVDRKGKPMIVDTSNPAQPLILSSSSDDTVTALQQAVDHLQPVCRGGKSLGLMGIGDGYLLNYLAHESPKLLMDQQQTIH